MLLLNTETGKITYFVELDGKPNEPIVVNLDYMQDTAPSNPQEKQIWYNTSDNKIYTYKNGAWDAGTEPSVGVFYKFGDNYYLWDGDSLEITDLNIYEKIANKTDNYTETSSIKYPSSKALSEAIDSIKNTLTLFDGNTGTVLDTHANLGTVIIFKNGQQIYAGTDRDYTINGSIITFTEPLVETDVIAVVNNNLVGLQLSAVATSGDYNDLINKPVMSFSQVELTKVTANDTFVDLAQEIQSKNLPTGTILYGEVYNTPKPAGINNAEVKVEILDTKTSGQYTGKQVLKFTLYSSDVEPYQWTFVYYQPNYEQNQQIWEWHGIGGGGSSTATINYFEGTTGTTLDTQLTLGNSVFVFKNGVLLQPTADYTISGSIITFVKALISTDKVAVINGDLEAIDMTPYVLKPTIITDATSTNMALTGNTIYKWTSAITELDIDSCEVSDYETVLYFTTGGTITFTVDSSIKWGGDGSAPSLEINTIYCISIRNGLAEYDTFGTVS